MKKITTYTTQENEVFSEKVSMLKVIKNGLLNIVENAEVEFPALTKVTGYARVFTGISIQKNGKMNAPKLISVNEIYIARGAVLAAPKLKDISHPSDTVSSKLEVFSSKIDLPSLERVFRLSASDSVVKVNKIEHIPHLVISDRSIVYAPSLQSVDRLSIEAGSKLVAPKLKTKNIKSYKIETEKSLVNTKQRKKKRNLKKKIQYIKNW